MWPLRGPLRRSDWNSRRDVQKCGWDMLRVARNDQLTLVRVRGRKQEDKWASSKHVSHILKKAPERRDIRAYFRGAMWSYGAPIGRLLGRVQPLHHSAIPQIYLPAKRKRVKLLKKDFTAVVEVTLLETYFHPGAASPAVTRRQKIRLRSIRVHEYLKSTQRYGTRIYLALWGKPNPTTTSINYAKLSLSRGGVSPARTYCSRASSDFINLHF